MVVWKGVRIPERVESGALRGHSLIRRCIGAMQVSASSTIAFARRFRRSPHLSSNRYARAGADVELVDGVNVSAYSLGVIVPSAPWRRPV